MWYKGNTNITEVINSYVLGVFKINALPVIIIILNSFNSGIFYIYYRLYSKSREELATPDMVNFTLKYYHPISQSDTQHYYTSSVPFFIAQEQMPSTIPISSTVYSL